METSALEKLFQAAIAQVDDSRIQEELERILAGTDSIFLPEEAVEVQDAVDEKKSKSIADLIRSLSVPGRIKLALLGNMTARALLIRDPNRQIPLFVLENPRLTENEVYEFAKNTAVDESVLREIAKNSHWMKTYQIKHAIVGNPKCPIDIALQWVKHLRDKDLKLLAKSKNVSNVIATQCRKLIEKRTPTA